MELLQLTYFLALSKTCNLTRTARELYISPPSLSGSIARLESELGTKLFDRTGNKLKLNEAGNLFRVYVENSMDELNKGVAAVKEKSLTENNVLKVAHTSVSLMSKLMLEFMRKHPEVTVTQTNISLDDLAVGIDLLRKFDLLVACPSDFDSYGLEHIILYDDDHIMLMVPADHPIADRDMISLKEISNEKIIALTKDYSARKMYDAIWKDAGIEPNIILECDYSMRSVMVAKGIGISMCTRRVSEIGPQRKVRYLQIDESKVARQQGIFWNPKRKMTKAMKSFLETSKGLFEDQKSKEEL